MASNRGVLLLVCFFVICVASFSSHVKARESMFFSKMMNHPLRRYSQLVSFSMPASVAAAPAPAPAPASSEIEPAASENYVYGFYGEEFPVTTTKAAAETVHKTSGTEDDDFVNDSHFFTQDDNQRYGANSDTRFNSYDDDEYSSNNAQLSKHPKFFDKSSYRNNNNVRNYDYTRSYNNDDNMMYESNYNTDQYTNGANYNSDRSKARRFVDNGRSYDDNGDGYSYYRDNKSPNEFNSMEEDEGVYQP